MIRFEMESTVMFAALSLYLKNGCVVMLCDIDEKDCFEKISKRDCQVEEKANTYPFFKGSRAGIHSTNGLV